MNNYKPYILNIAITQKCNFNCRYCFTTKDLSPRADEYNIIDFCKLLDEAKDLGITHIRFYGGEPLLHPHIDLLIKAVYARGLILQDIFTNGSLITDEFLDTLAIDSLLAPFPPAFHISFDGVGGMHNKFSQTNSDNKVLENIKKVIDRGYFVKTHMVLCKSNEPYLKDTIKEMKNLGVPEMRILKLMPSPKWQEYSKDTEYKTDKEWYDLSLKYAKWYMENGKNISENDMNLEFWNTIYIYPNEKRLRLLPIKGCKDFKNGLDYACPSYATTISIAGNGEILPCHQMGGIMKYEGITMPNVNKIGLKKALESDEFKKNVLLTTEDKFNSFKECKKCKFWNWCVGGCPLYGWEWRRKKGDSFPLYLDVSKCTFFNEKYFTKFKEILPNEWMLDKGDFPWD